MSSILALDTRRACCAPTGRAPPHPPWIADTSPHVNFFNRSLFAVRRAARAAARSPWTGAGHVTGHGLPLLAPN